MKGQETVSPMATLWVNQLVASYALYGQNVDTEFLDVPFNHFGDMAIWTFGCSDNPKIQTSENPILSEVLYMVCIWFVYAFNMLCICCQYGNATVTLH